MANKDPMDWIEISKISKPIGAIGFLDGKAVAVAAYYEDRDGNKDGKVSWGEKFAAFMSPISLEGAATTEVAMAARHDLNVLERDPSFANEATKMYLNFARGLVLDGIYAAYFNRGAKLIGKGTAATLTSNKVAEFVIRKGSEKALKEAFKEAVDR